MKKNTDKNKCNFYTIIKNKSGLGDQLLSIKMAGLIGEKLNLEFAGIENLFQTNRSTTNTEIYQDLGLSELAYKGELKKTHKFIDFIFKLDFFSDRNQPITLNYILDYIEQEVIKTKVTDFYCLRLQLGVVICNQLIAHDSSININETKFNKRLRIEFYSNNRIKENISSLSLTAKKSSMKILFHIRLGDTAIFKLGDSKYVMPFGCKIKESKDEFSGRLDRLEDIQYLFNHLVKYFQALGSNSSYNLITDGYQKGVDIIRSKAKDINFSSDEIENIEIDATNLKKELYTQFQHCDNIIYGESYDSLLKSIYMIFNSDIIISTSGHFVYQILSSFGRRDKQYIFVKPQYGRTLSKVNVNSLEITWNQPLNEIANFITYCSQNLLQSYKTKNEEHRMPIKFDLKKYLNPIFVETGTFHGDGVRQALNAGFDKVYSIEVKEEFYHECCQKFSKEIEEGRVELLLGDSEYKLIEIIEKISQPATFWLDAHPMPGNARGEKNCPLYEEIDSIGQHRIKNHTILIDDIRLIRNGGKGWGGHSVTVEGLKARLRKINEKYNIVFENGFIENDVLCAFPNQQLQALPKQVEPEQFKLISNLRLPLPNGVIHVGANIGQEATGYATLNNNTYVYIEPIPEVYETLVRRLETLPKTSKHIPIKALISDTNDTEILFNIASNNGQSSSIFELGKHGILHPNIQYERSIKLTTKTLDSLIKEKFESEAFEMLVMDTQGAELKVLLGATTLLQNSIKYIYAEVSEDPLYDGGCTFEQVTSFLKLFNFALKNLKLNARGWGNALYTKKYQNTSLQLTNIALHKPCKQSSVSQWSKPDDAQGAVNGIKTGDFGFHTSKENDPWWQVDLQDSYPISQIIVYNRVKCNPERANHLKILFSDDEKQWTQVHKYKKSQPFGGIDGSPLVAKFNNQKARYIRLQIDGFSFLHLDEVEVYA